MVGTKRRRDADDAEEHSSYEAQTPSRRGQAQHLAGNRTPRSILKKPSLLDGLNGATPRSNRKLVFETPTKPPKDETPNATPAIVRNADRSARRKSNRRILERTLNGAESDGEASGDEDELAEQILDAEEEEEPDQGVEPAQEEAPAPDTPSKRARGRPKGSGKPARPRKEPSPPPTTELPPHEEYFYQNRPGGTKTSNHTLSAQTLLNHDEYFQSIQSYRDRHEPEMLFLLDLHGRAYDQWIFELEEGFNVCLYGYGSKRIITEKFTQRLYAHLSESETYRATKKKPKIAVVNGYAAGITIKHVLTTVASTVVPTNIKMPNQPNSLLDFLTDYLTINPPPHPVPLIVNSIDSPNLRKTPFPAMLARLAAHPSINLICTADMPNFSLLWDVGLKTQYKFLYHDATTFAPYDSEIDVVESVNELLGRSGRRVGGRDGVGFVLRSLPEHARSLFQILVLEQLALSQMGGEDDDEPQLSTKSRKIGQPKNPAPETTLGVEYRVLYHMAKEQFVCTSEVSFRTLLKEFHDHQMIESRKDGMGTERLWVPFRQEELEGLAADLAEAAP